MFALAVCMPLPNCCETPQMAAPARTLNTEAHRAIWPPQFNSFCIIGPPGMPSAVGFTYTWAKNVPNPRSPEEESADSGADESDDPLAQPERQPT